MSLLIDAYDAALFDLDGVIYVGPQAVPGAPDALAQLAERGVSCAYVTNNASRGPETVADHLRELGIPATPADVVTSAQAIARVMASELAPGALVYIFGAAALENEIAAVGLTPTRDPQAEVAALVQGYNPQWTVPDFQDACVVLERGVPWYASNNDATIPTNRGIMPGMGSYVELIAAATGTRPITIAGKPFRPLLDTMLQRRRPQTPIFVGDRLDTDIEGARAVGIDSLFVVNSGAHGKADLVAAPQHQRPSYLGSDVSALLEPARGAVVVGTVARCGAQKASLVGETISIGTPRTLSEQLDTLWCIAQLAWKFPDSDTQESLSGLELIR